MLPMAKTKEQPPAQEPDEPPRRQVNARLPLDVARALKNYLKSIHVPPTMTAVTIAALREFLKREGFYPPSP